MIEEQPVSQFPRPKWTLLTIFLVGAGTLIAVVIALATFIFGYFLGDLRELDQADKTPVLVDDQEAAEAPVGYITGSLSFPSEYLPENMEICATNLARSSEYCTSNHIDTDEEPYGKGYRLAVPAGVYQVYAQLPGDEQKAYYSEFVTCGLSAECPSHEPIEVEVEVGETVSNVDPHDWYVIEP